MKSSQHTKPKTSGKNIYINSKCPCPTNQDYTRKSNRTPLSDIQDSANKQYLSAEYGQKGITEVTSKSNSYFLNISPIKSESTRITRAPPLKQPLTKIPATITVRPTQKTESQKQSSHRAPVRTRSSSCRCSGTQNAVSSETSKRDAIKSTPHKQKTSDNVFSKSKTQPHRSSTSTKPPVIKVTRESLATQNNKHNYDSQNKKLCTASSTIHKARSAENLSLGHNLKPTISNHQRSCSSNSRPRVPSKSTLPQSRSPLKIPQITQNGEAFIPLINPDLLTSGQKNKFIPTKFISTSERNAPDLVATNCQTYTSLKEKQGFTKPTLCLSKSSQTTTDSNQYDSSTKSSTTTKRDLECIQKIASPLEKQGYTSSKSADSLLKGSKSSTVPKISHGNISTKSSTTTERDLNIQRIASLTEKKDYCSSKSALSSSKGSENSTVPKISHENISTKSSTTTERDLNIQRIASPIEKKGCCSSKSGLSLSKDSESSTVPKISHGNISTKSSTTTERDLNIQRIASPIEKKGCCSSKSGISLSKGSESSTVPKIAHGNSSIKSSTTTEQDSVLQYIQEVTSLIEKQDYSSSKSAISPSKSSENSTVPKISRGNSSTISSTTTDRDLKCHQKIASQTEIKGCCCCKSALSSSKVPENSTVSKISHENISTKSSTTTVRDLKCIQRIASPIEKKGCCSGKSGLSLSKGSESSTVPKIAHGNSSTKSSTTTEQDSVLQYIQGVTSLIEKQDYSSSKSAISPSKSSENATVPNISRGNSSTISSTTTDRDLKCHQKIACQTEMKGCCCCKSALSSSKVPENSTVSKISHGNISTKSSTTTERDLKCIQRIASVIEKQDYTSSKCALSPSKDSENSTVPKISHENSSTKSSTTTEQESALKYIQKITSVIEKQDYTSSKCALSPSKDSENSTVPKISHENSSTKSSTTTEQGSALKYIQESTSLIEKQGYSSSKFALSPSKVSENSTVSKISHENSSTKSSTTTEWDLALQYVQISGSPNERQSHRSTQYTHSSSESSENSKNPKEYQESRVRKSTPKARRVLPFIYLETDTSTDQTQGCLSETIKSERVFEKCTTLPSQNFVTLSQETMSSCSEIYDVDWIGPLNNVKVVRDSSVFSEEDRTFVDAQIFLQGLEPGKDSMFKTVPVCSPLNINVPIRRSNSLSECETGKRIKTTLKRKSSKKKVIFYPQLYSPEYLEDMILYSYRHMNNFLLPTEWIEKYMDRRYRTVTINWLLQVKELISPAFDSVFYMTVRHFDYTVIKLRLRKSYYQLAAIVAFWISLKYLNTSVVLKIPKMYSLCNGQYSKEEILSMERTILKTIKYSLNMSDPLDFLYYYLKSANLEKKELLKYGSKFVMECASLFENYSMVKPPFLAASALYLAYTTLTNTKVVYVNFIWFDRKRVQKYAEDVLSLNVRYVIIEKFEPLNKYLTPDKLQVAKHFLNI